MPELRFLQVAVLGGCLSVCQASSPSDIVPTLCVSSSRIGVSESCDLFILAQKCLRATEVAGPSGVVCLSSPFASLLHISASVLCPQLNPADKLLICHKSANTQTKNNVFYTLPFVLNSLHNSISRCCADREQNTV